MKVICELNSMNNLRLLSYFKPNKFRLKDLADAESNNISGAFLVYLKNNVHTCDISYYDNKVELLFEDDSIEMDNEYFSGLESFKVKEIYIYNNEEKDILLQFSLENGSIYTDCILDNIKFINGDLKGLITDMYGGGYLVYNAKTFEISLLEKDEYKLCNKLFER